MPNNAAAAATEVAALLRTHRYEQTHGQERIDLWHALNDIAAEIAYHLDAEHVISTSTLETWRTAAGLDQGALGKLPVSAELILTTLIQKHIDALPEARNATE